MPGHECSTASVPPTMRCSSILKVLAGPAPQFESKKVVSSRRDGFRVVVVVVVASLVNIIVVVEIFIHSIAGVKVRFVK